MIASARPKRPTAAPASGLIQPVPMCRYLTPPAVARELGIATEKIIGWIRRGELRAVDLAATGSRRPRFRVSRVDLAAFLERRTVQPPAPRPARRQKQPSNVTAYF